MYRRCSSTPLLDFGPSPEAALDKSIRAVYPELSINFQYVDVAGLKLTGMTLEGY